jgi:putative ABC transport system permease protein
VVPFTTLPPPGAMRDGLDLDSGRLPERDGEIVLHRQLARDLGVDLNGTLTLLPPTNDGVAPSPVTATVVGLWSGEGRFGPGEYMAFATPVTANPWLDDLWVPGLYVELDGETDATAVTGAIVQTVPGASVIPASDMIDREVARYQDEWGIVQLGITSFAILALIVAGMVVANTCAILVAQRTREIALFRCAGATASQMRRLVLVEAVAAGMVASVAGVLLAWGAGNAVLATLAAMGVLTSLPDRIGLAPAMVIVPIVAGLVVSVVAAWAPSRTAARVDPLQALRTAQAPPVTGTRPDPIRLGIAILLMAGGAVFLLGGAAISASGSPQSGVLVGIVGGLGTFLGVLVAATLIVPAINRFILRLAERLPSIPLRVAASNGVRNPRRATASTVALVIGVTLVSMMVVGADSLKATMTGEIDSQAPWDLGVRYEVVPDVATAGEFATTVETLDGVAAIAPMAGVEVSYEDTYGETITEARIVDPATLQAVWRDSAALASFGPGTALVPGWLLDTTGLADGDTLVLEIAGTAVPFTISETPAWDSIIIPGADVEGIDATIAPASLVVRLDDDAGTDEVIDAIYDAAGARNIAIAAESLASQRETLEQALDTMLYIVTGLLAVAVLIAVIGVGNTLSLSVIERTSESALLRAVGYTRSQLRRTMMLEGVLLAAVGSAIGLGLGLAYGWIGAFTLVGNSFTMVPGFPAGRLALIAVVAIACGLLASVLPARRAASADPVVALADH